MIRDFRGAFVALITPLKPNGKIDTKTLRKLVSWQIEQGTDGILCCGATGEGILLTDSEKKQVAQICVETAENRIPILVATGSASTSQTVRLTEQMQKVGVAGALVVTPYYCKPTADGCFAHFTEVAKTRLPIIPYYNPKRTSCVLKAKDVAAFGKIPDVVAIKDSSGDPEFTKEIATSVPVLSGDDDCTFQSLRYGAIGAISVIGNIFPKHWKEMIHLALKKQWNEAEQLNQRFLPLCKAMFLEPNPECIKWAANWLGLSPKTLRLPLVEIQETTKQAIRRLIVQLGLPQYQIVTGSNRNFDFR